MESFKDRLAEALKRLFTSVKVITLLVGLIVAWAAKRGIVLDPSMVTEVMVLFSSLLLGQGLTDIGVRKAEVEAKAPKMPEQINVQNVTTTEEKK